MLALAVLAAKTFVDDSQLRTRFFKQKLLLGFELTLFDSAGADL